MNSVPSQSSRVPQILSGLLVLAAGLGCILWWGDFLKLRRDTRRGASRTYGDFSDYAAALEIYRIRMGQLPTQAQGLGALCRRPEDLPPSAAWKPVGDGHVMFYDFWGSPYHYMRDDSLPGGFGIYSTGPDRISRSQGNDSDDFNSWTGQ